MSTAGPPSLETRQPTRWCLWTRGDSSYLNRHSPRVAVIGARVPTDCGRDVARALAIDLADRGVTILGSGWPGIDAQPSWVQPWPVGRQPQCYVQGWPAPTPAAMPTCSGQLSPTEVSGLTYPRGDEGRRRAHWRAGVLHEGPAGFDLPLVLT
ncbi:DNA-processing protein DprA [Promicromonospora iranensis]|uniref:DNA-processing protein DprA n=1 Tax=Promicromonospora iranensis TaxID=1105144 RepID=UPI0035B566F4